MTLDRIARARTTPNNVPAVFDNKSVMEDTRLGSHAWMTSIVRLTAAPARTTNKALVRPLIRP